MTQTFEPGTLDAQDVLRLALTSKVYGAAVQTALSPAPALSERLGHRVWLKREDQQPIFSFKLRGAYNRMAQLSAAERARGVITASAGNHAQGVAYSAQELGVRAVIVMPATTPEIKVRACRARGAEVVLHGDSFSDAETHAYALQRGQGLTFVHPYDDPHVLAGQATVALELLRQLDEDRPYTVFVPVGGGGLIAGVASVMKALRPDVRIIGVEPDDSDAMYQSLQAGHRVRLDTVGIFVDGVAVKQVGAYTFDLTRRYVDGWVRVSTDEVCAAIKDVFDDTRAVMEPAGALAVAGLKQYAERLEESGQTLVALTCGANVNFDRLRHVAERAEIGEQREAILAVTIPERPGAFREFIEVIGPRAVTEFNYRYAPREDARIFVGVQLARAAQRAELLGTLTSRGYPVTDLTDDELAKVHVRHMVGGRAPEAAHERVYSFTFPERPGALLEFLTHLHGRWNISLFHYRNHGSAHGRVLAGLQVPPGDEADFTAFLHDLGYPATEMSTNPSYRLFLT
ncbi:threonine ammonia-lyase, biosynthetic [Deinococcus deserti]|uniref:L-threonine dehydratase n=1 Tax=Deinococcus deserti (strain DSM 17065 / CIP 109153 / LMG 22923 / VCD115) TaxID=546414 RepID=C1D010_DEIDV|nr:threonine ammonia-lyase, biosynthetic [Deinococcus deserti]ACO45262.1 putative Threonine dehydratase biosynthetic (Threonine deaminase) [Deinococcus deserti VCD115]